MNDYMRALHQQFYREPDFSELEEDIENTRQEVRDCLDKLQRRRLMHLVDTQNLLREETSLASFTAGFKLAWGLSKELEADGLYHARLNIVQHFLKARAVEVSARIAIILVNLIPRDTVLFGILG